MASESHDQDENKVVATEAKVASKKKPLVIIGIIVLLFLIGAPSIYFLLIKKNSEVKVEEADPGLLQEDIANNTNEVNAEEEIADGETLIGPLFPLDTFVVNLKESGFIRVQIQIEFNTRDIPSIFIKKNIVVRDAVISMLSKKTKETLLSEQGKTVLKDEIKSFINELLKKEEVSKIYFSQFVIQ